MDDRRISDRITTVASATPFRALLDFMQRSSYQERRHEPGVLDFTFGDPHDPPSEAYVEILRESLIPQHELWFAYNTGDATACRACDLPSRTGQRRAWRRWSSGSGTPNRP